jgi:hypothetical protein
VYAIEKQDGVWKIYSSALPTVIMPRELEGKDDGKNRLEYLGQFAFKQIVNWGYYKKWTCQIDDLYIESRFTPSLYRNHEAFLRDIDVGK